MLHALARPHRPQGTLGSPSVSLLRNRQPVLPQEAQLVPVAALEGDLAVLHAEEAAAAQAQRVLPFQHGPLAVLEEVFHDAHHLGPGELRREHPPDGLPALHRLFRHLVVHGVLGIEGGHTVRVGGVEGHHPRGDHFLGRHPLHPPEGCGRARPRRQSPARACPFPSRKKAQAGQRLPPPGRDPPPALHSPLGAPRPSRPRRPP